MSGFGFADVVCEAEPQLNPGADKAVVAFKKARVKSSRPIESLKYLWRLIVWASLIVPGVNWAVSSFFQPDQIDLDDMVGAVNLIALTTSLMMTTVAAIPLAMLFVDIKEMDERIWAGREAWTIVFEMEGITKWDMRSGEDTGGILDLAISNKTNDIPIKSLEACVGWRKGLFRGSAKTPNYNLHRAPSQILNDEVAKCVWLLLSGLAIASGLVVHSATIRFTPKTLAANSGVMRRVRSGVQTRRRPIATETAPSSAPIKAWMYWASPVYAYCVISVIVGFVQIGTVMGIVTNNMNPNYASIRACRAVGWHLDPAIPFGSADYPQYIGGSFIGARVHEVNSTLYAGNDWKPNNEYVSSPDGKEFVKARHTPFYGFTPDGFLGRDGSQTGTDLAEEMNSVTQWRSGYLNLTYIGAWGLMSLVAWGGAAANKAAGQYWSPFDKACTPTKKGTWRLKGLNQEIDIRTQADIIEDYFVSFAKETGVTKEHLAAWKGKEMYLNMILKEGGISELAPRVAMVAHLQSV